MPTNDACRMRDAAVYGVGTIVLVAAPFFQKLLNISVFPSPLYAVAAVLGPAHRPKRLITAWALLCAFSAGLAHIFDVSVTGRLWDVGLASDFVVIACVTRLTWSRSTLARRAEDLSREVQDLKAFADSVPQVLWGTRADGYCDFLNARYTEVFGIPVATAINDQSWASPVHPDDRGKMYEIWRNAVDTGATDFRAYGRFRFKDGTYHWMQSVGRSVRSETGEVSRWYGGLLDVDAEIIAQQTIERLNGELQDVIDERTSQLENLEWRLEMLFEDKSVGILELDIGTVKSELADSAASVAPPGRHEHSDIFAEWRDQVRALSLDDRAAALLGYRDMSDFERSLRSETVGPATSIVRSIFEAVHSGTSGAKGAMTVAKGDAGPKRFTFEIKIQADGRSYVFIAFVPQRDETQEAIIEARRELVRANRAAVTGALSIAVLHDISQPLTALSIDLSTAIRMVDLHQPGVQKAVKALERVRGNAQRLIDITTHTRERIRQHHRITEAVDVVGVLREAGRLLELDAIRQSIELRIEAPREVPRVFADRSELQQVFVNLLLNALDAVAEVGGDGKVTASVDVEPHGKSVLVEISDSGPGIPKENLGRVFEPFFTTRPNGMGFGLQISRATVEAIGGQISCRNGQAGGAVFSVALPWAADVENPTKSF